MLNTKLLKFAAVAMALVAVASCKKEPNEEPQPTPSDETLVAPVLTVSPASAVLSQDKADEAALTFSWTSAIQTGGKLKATYTLYANLESNDLYTSPVKFEAFGNEGIALSNSQLNTLALDLGTVPGEEAKLQFAVYAVADDKDVESVVSNVVKAAVTTFSEKIVGPEKMIIAGSAVGGWDLSTAPLMDQIEVNVYQIEGQEVRLTPDDVGFKFYFSADDSDMREVAQDPASANFGDCKIFDSDAASLFQPARNGYTQGVYTIKLDLNALKMTMTRTGDISSEINWPDNLYMKGNCMDWAWNTPDILLAKVSDKVYEAKSVHFSFNENDPQNPCGFKIFLADDSWSPYIAMSESSTDGNIILEVIEEGDVPQIYPGKLGFESGTYDVKADLNSMAMTLTKVESGPETEYIYMAGDAVPWSWAIDSPDAKIASVEKNVYETVATLNTEAGFKVWGTINWAPEYGMYPNSTADNIKFGLMDDIKAQFPDEVDPQFYLGKIGIPSGTYTLRFDFNTMTLSVKGASAELRSAYLYGCAFADYTDWADWIELKETAAGSDIYKLSGLKIKAGEGDYNYGFKIYRAKEDWSNEYCCDKGASTGADNIIFAPKSDVGDNQVCPLDFGLGSGTYDITVDFNTKKVTFTAVPPAGDLRSAFLFGCAFADYTDWSDWIELKETATGTDIYVVSDLKIKAGEGDYNYGFKIYRAKEDWSNEYCCDKSASTGADNIIFAPKSDVGDNQVCPLDFGLGSGTYDIKVDFTNMKVTFIAK